MSNDAVPASRPLPRIGGPARRPRPLLWWDLGVAATVAVMGAFGLAWALDADGVPAAVPLLRALWTLALLVVWYLVLGRSALRRAVRDDPARPIDLVYLGGVVLIVGLATMAVPSYATLQTLAYPMVWTIVARYRDAVLWSAALAVAMGSGFVLALGRYGALEAVREATTIAVLSFAFAVAMGTWITRIFAQGERYRALAEQLRVSQAEVVALSERAGAGRERERLSRELHDTLTQTLAGLVMLSEQAERALAAGDAERARDRLARVGAAARDAVGEARALVATTQPLGDGGLEAAIERIAARLSVDAGLNVECELEAVSLDRERQVVLLRAAQEGLANARRHARASRVVLALTAPAQGGAVLVVEDDGVGPDPERMRLGGFGLSGIADRVRVVGGAVSFGSGAGGGARLEVRLPGSGSGSGQGEGSGSGEVEGSGSGSGSGPASGARPGSGSDPDPGEGSGSGSDPDPGEGSGSGSDPGAGSAVKS
ncbi:sensor histidine kinase [Leucobacter triazinivorans]|uniref:histidine kinase n=2 Tax=Leucobacter triazinivorans TaxID=1784719 RepID=A0A4P6KIR7_9MICO|nr:sensor histidine kinase [Leucobacter triazinivorans]